MTTIIQKFSEISANYQVAFVDLWGCVHNGVAPFDGAVSALRDFRVQGGRVVLVTNAPRSHWSVRDQLDRIGVARDCWDSIATSGDSARHALFSGVVGQRVYFIGQPHDLSFFEPMALFPDAPEISRVSLREAEGIVCTGPIEPFAALDDSRGILQEAVDRGLKLLCANPDIVVDRGEKREWCAGALAAIYTELGGESLYFGKPHLPIYDLAWRRLEALGGGVVNPSQVIAIGDGVATDVAGAKAAGLDCLFISGGLAAQETKTKADPDPAFLKAYLDHAGQNPRWTIGLLR